MLPVEIKKSKNNASQEKLKHMYRFMIKIDYFDQKGAKNLENTIPLTSIFTCLSELRK